MKRFIFFDCWISCSPPVEPRDRWFMFGHSQVTSPMSPPGFLMLSPRCLRVGFCNHSACLSLRCPSMDFTAAFCLRLHGSFLLENLLLWDCFSAQPPTGLMPRARVSVPPHARKVDVQKKRNMLERTLFCVVFGSFWRSHRWNSNQFRIYRRNKESQRKTRKSKLNKQKLKNARAQGKN